MRVLLEFEHFCLLIFKFTAGLIRIRVLLEGESYLRIYGIWCDCFKTEFLGLLISGRVLFEDLRYMY